MNWLSSVLVVWAFISALDDSWGSVVLGQKLRHLSLVLHAKCTYSYEVAVHTVRGAHSTASDGFQIHALVSLYVYRYLFLCSAISVMTLLEF